MNAEQAGDLCQLIESLLRRGYQPSDRIRRAARALALDAAGAANKDCPMLLFWTGIPRTTPGVTPGITESTQSTSHDANLDTGLIPVGEAARRLGVTTHAVRAAARRGSLPAVKDDSGCWQIDLKDVEKRCWSKHRAINLQPVTPLSRSWTACRTFTPSSQARRRTRWTNSHG